MENIHFRAGGLNHYSVLQALSVDPVVDKADAAEKLVDVMLDKQREYLGYIA